MEPNSGKGELDVKWVRWGEKRSFDMKTERKTDRTEVIMDTKSIMHGFIIIII